jgi:type I restriction enzyme S subunit
MFRSCRLDDIVAAVNDKTSFVKNQMLPYIGLEHLRIRGEGLNGSSLAAKSISINTIFKPGDVLFGKLRPNLRKCTLAPFDGYCSTDILVLRPRDGISPRFAARVFQSEHIGAAAEMSAAGTKMPRTSWNALRTLEVYCPDIESQESVADVLETLDTTIRQTEAIIEKLKLVKKGLLHDLLTRGIDANGELRPPQSQAPHLYKDSPLGWIPREWMVDLLDSVADRGSGHTPSKSVPSYWNGGIKWVSLAERKPIRRSANLELRTRRL